MNFRYPFPPAHTVYILFLLLPFFLLPASAADKHSPRSTDQASVAWTKKVQQGYSAKVWLSNQLIFGKLAFDDGNPPPVCGADGIGFEYPAGSCVEHLYGAGVWFGGIQDGIRKVTEAYNGDNGLGYFIPEQKDTSVNLMWKTSIREHNHSPSRKGFDDDGDGKIDQDDLDGLDNDSNWVAATDDIGADGIPDSLETGCKGGYDPVLNPDPAYDDFFPSGYDSCHQNNNGTFPRKLDRNKYTEKNGRADHGEPHVDEDFGAVSENDIYSAATDTFRLPVYSNHRSLGVKTFMKSYAWPEAGGEGIIINEYLFVNVGKKNISSIYLGMFADVDIGPVNTVGYYNNNYAAYDPQSLTAYAMNPVDKGSTPFGISFLNVPEGAPKRVFRWWDLSGSIGPGTVDSMLYTFMSGGDCSGPDCIQADQPVTKLSDTRFFVSAGPFADMHPGDTLRFVTAIVSGYSVEDMLANARRARRIFQSGFQLPVAVHVEDHGNSTLGVSWDSTVSPYGEITSYRVYYGTSANHPTDSLTTFSNHALLSGLTAPEYHIAVRAIDDHGDLGPLSDDVTNAPVAPQGIHTEPQERRIIVRWQRVPNVAGYNLYRSTSILSPGVKLNASLITDTIYSDESVVGDTLYRYTVTAVGGNKLESGSVLWANGALIAPKTPRGIACPGPTFIKLIWENDEADIAGFNIYRLTLNGGTWRNVNQELLRSDEYNDETVSPDSQYIYKVVAVDSTGATSPAWNSGVIRTVKHDKGILFVNLLIWPTRYDSLNTMINRLLPNVQKSITSSVGNDLSGTLMLGRYSTVVLVFDSISYPYADALNFRAYLVGQGKLVITSRLLSQLIYPKWMNFLTETFGIHSILEVNPTYNFSGAAGANGFPDVSLSASLAPLKFVEYFNGIPADRVLYTYKSNPLSPEVEGKPVGVKSLDGNAYWTTFPLNAVRESDAGAMLTHILQALGEQTALLSAPGNAAVPAEFRTYDAYPNPFNPSTRIRFDLPEAGYATVTIYDLLGRQVEQLFNGPIPEGTHEVGWSAPRAASGVYFYRVQFTGSGIERRQHDMIRKIVLMK